MPCARAHARGLGRDESALPLPEPFCAYLHEEVLHELMPLLCEGSAGLGLHHAFELEQFVSEMCHAAPLRLARGSHVLLFRERVRLVRYPCVLFFSTLSVVFVAQAFAK